MNTGLEAPHVWSPVRPVGRPARLAVGIALLGCLPSLGCYMTATERHHFKSVDEAGDPINYFRVTVEAGSLLSSSRYLSGYFDERAVDTYFGTFKQPADGLFPPPLPAPQTQPAGSGTGPAEGCLEPLDASLEGRKLVLLMSSNSDEIAAQIGTLADSREVSGLVQRLTGLSAEREAAAAESKRDSRKVGAKDLALLGERLLAQADPKNPDDTQRLLLVLVNAVAASLGNARTFASFEEGEEWLRFTRPHLLGD